MQPGSVLMHLPRVTNDPCKATRFLSPGGTRITCGLTRFNYACRHAPPEPTCGRGSGRFGRCCGFRHTVETSAYPAVVSAQTPPHFPQQHQWRRECGGYPGQGSGLCSTQATTYPIALLSGDGAALFIHWDYGNMQEAWSTNIPHCQICSHLLV